MMATHSPRLDAEGDAAQRVHLLAAHVVDAGDVLDVDEHGGVPAPLASLATSSRPAHPASARSPCRRPSAPWTACGTGPRPPGPPPPGPRGSPGRCRRRCRCAPGAPAPCCPRPPRRPPWPASRRWRFAVRPVPSTGGLESGSVFSGRTVTAWMGTSTVSSCVSAVMRTSALMPGSTPGGREVSATVTGKVVTSASVPGFLMSAFWAISTTVPSKVCALERVHARSRPSGRA